MVRTFISVEIPENIKEEIINIQNKLVESKLFSGKLTEIENLHLTLKFLGEIDKNNVEIIKEELKNIKFDTFEVELDKIGVFDKNFIRIIWISLRGKGLFELQRKIDESLTKFFKKEERFMAHITISRPKFVNDKKKLIEFIEKMNLSKMKFKVDKFFFKKSELTKKGPKYSDLMIILNK
ncbi:MAG TPA: RNA 2',3'-cyclic phosphodiesterase [Candidatus Paceibacterota bacterium]|nr:RNA 2',3'-cyclic phosphodiesterase [Candidatus Paceibacterota bacterium]